MVLMTLQLVWQRMTGMIARVHKNKEYDTAPNDCSAQEQSLAYGCISKVSDFGKPARYATLVSNLELKFCNPNSQNRLKIIPEKQWCSHFWMNIVFFFILPSFIMIPLAIAVIIFALQPHIRWQDYCDLIWFYAITKLYYCYGILNFKMP